MTDMLVLNGFQPMTDIEMMDVDGGAKWWQVLIIAVVCIAAVAAVAYFCPAAIEPATKIAMAAITL
jgi:lactobin A/cerein 7B family class IIb bacteriocin